MPAYDDLLSMDVVDSCVDCGPATEIVGMVAEFAKNFDTRCELPILLGAIRLYPCRRPMSRLR